MQQQSEIDRLPPQAVEVERAVLGAMLLSKDAVDVAVELLTAAQFYHAPHSRIFAAAQALTARSQAVDQLTVADELKRRGQLEDVGGVVYLAGLASEVATGANIRHHAGIVTRTADLRYLIETGADLVSRAYEGQAEPSEMADWLASRLSALYERGQHRRVRALQEIVPEALAHVERVHSRQQAATGVDTGYSALNDLTSGFQPGDLSIMAARPSIGKTALALCMAHRAAGKGHLSLIYSMEMSCTQVAQRLMAIDGGTDLHRMRSGHLREADWKQINHTSGCLTNLPVYVDDSPTLTVTEARAKARQMQRAEGLDLVIIDYVQLMQPEQRKGASREQEVSSISRGLKAMARDLNVSVLAISQLSRAVETRHDRRPRLSDLRESGSLEQDADLVMLLYRPSYYGITTIKGRDVTNLAEVIVAKQRNGPTDTVELLWDAGPARFETLAAEYRMDLEDQQHPYWQQQ